MKKLAILLMITLATFAVGCVGPGAIRDLGDAVESAKVAVDAKATALSAEVDAAKLALKSSIANVEAALDRANELKTAEAAKLREDLEAKLADLDAKTDASIKADKDTSAKVDKALTSLKEEGERIATGIGMMKEAITNPAGNDFFGLPIDANKLAAGAMIALFGNNYLSERRKKKRDEANGVSMAELIAALKRAEEHPSG
jgi:hypothetical protein